MAVVGRAERARLMGTFVSVEQRADGSEGAHSLRKRPDHGLVLQPGGVADGISAWYVGAERWTLPWLPERTVSTLVAVAAVCAGHALRRCPGVDSTQWDQIHCGAAVLGLSAAGLARVLGVDCPIPEPPGPPKRPVLWIPNADRR
jgi:hypothetical protein